MPASASGPAGRRVLVVAKALDPNTTSEGIVSAKFVRALAGGAHEVYCLTLAEGGDAGHAGAATDAWAPESWLGGARLRVAAAAAPPRRGRLVRSALPYLTGFSAGRLANIARWREAIAAAVAAVRPDVVVVRGAGGSFEPHHAAVQARLGVPWVAHYHDPYPRSLYPEPYRQRAPFVSLRQEAAHRAIVAVADAVTFPSTRLAHWVLDGALARHRAKSAVLPHLASALETGPRGPGESDGGAALADRVSRSAVGGPLVLVHTGSLLEARDPRPLLRAAARFVAAHGAGALRLVQVGAVHRTHLAASEWKALAAAGVLSVHDGRVSYAQALAMATAADAAVLLEASTPESVFFPAKLADYAWLDRPVLALSPRASVAADLLGADHPLRAAPDDEPEILRALDTLRARRGATDPALLPPRPLRAALSEGAVRAAFDVLLNSLVAPSASEVRRAG